MNKLCVTTLLSVLATPAFAHQFEANINYGQSDTNLTHNSVYDSKTDRTMAGLTYYFSPLEYDQGPLALASFFGRNSSISVSRGKGTYKSDSPDIHNLDFKTTVVNGQYIDADTGWIIGGSYIKTPVEDMPYLNQKLDRKTTSLTIGKYFMPTSTLSVGFSRVKDRYNGDATTVKLSNFHAQQISDSSYFDGGIAIGYTDREKTADGFKVELASNYYPTANASVGLFGSYDKSDDLSTTMYGGVVKYYITQSFSVDATYAFTGMNDKTKVNQDSDTKTFQIGASLRF